MYNTKVEYISTTKVKRQCLTSIEINRFDVNSMLIGIT